MNQARDVGLYGAIEVVPGQLEYPPADGTPLGLLDALAAILRRRREAGR